MDRRWSTAGYVKLLLPPRQSRGNSYWGLVAGVLMLMIGFLAYAITHQII